MFGKKVNRWYFALRIICAIALVSLSFDHQPVALASNASSKGFSADFAAFLQPDGTLPILCFSAKKGSKRGNTGSGPCEACRLTASIVVPLAPSIGERLTAPIAVVQNQPKEIIVEQQGFPPAAPPRAPPIS